MVTGIYSYWAETQETEQQDVTFQVPPPGTYFLQPGYPFKIAPPTGDRVFPIGACGGRYGLKAERRPLREELDTVGRKDKPL